MSEKKLAEGFYFKRPRAGAPDFVKGSLSMRTDDCILFLNENKNESGYVNLDLLLSKNGENLYFTLNDWKPTPKEGAAVEYPQSAGDVGF